MHILLRTKFLYWNIWLLLGILYQEDIRSPPPNMMINQPNPNESMMPVRVGADLEEIPKPPVVARREINFLHTLFFFFFYYKKTHGPLDFSHVFLFLKCLTLVFTSIRSHFYCSLRLSYAIIFSIFFFLEKWNFPWPFHPSLVCKTLVF